MHPISTPKKLLTIGGLDPCGAFGVSADLKTFAALKAHGMSVTTVVTAQNSLGWYGAEWMPVEFVLKQFDAVVEDYGVDAVKTGFLGRIDLIEAVAERLGRLKNVPIVIDPVLVNARGRAMFDDAVVQAYRDRLFPLATAITPNIGEFELLAGAGEITEKRVEAAHAELLNAGQWLVAKGSFEQGAFGDRVTNGSQHHFFQREKIDTRNVSGSGDTFSAALAAHLAQSISPDNAIPKAGEFTHAALERGMEWDLASKNGPVGHF